MDRFLVALSSDFFDSNDRPAFPTFDLTPFSSDPTIEFASVAAQDGVMPSCELAEYDALVLLAPRFSRDSIRPGGRLNLVVRFGAGFDNVDLKACSEAGIAVVTTPQGVCRPVAVAIITFILALTGRLLVRDRATRLGPDGFEQRYTHFGMGLVDRVLGSVGLGRIATEMFRLARPFGMRFIAHTPRPKPVLASELDVKLVELNDVFREADIVVVNCPLTASTRHLVDARRLGLMKPGAYLINTARGGIVDHSALLQALQSGHLSGAGLDVFDPEPPDPGDPLLALENVILTPHSLCWTDQCFEVLGKLCIDAVMTFRTGEVPNGIVNPEVLGQPDWKRRLSQLKSESNGWAS